MDLKTYSEEYIRRTRETFVLDPDVILSIMGPAGRKDWHLLFNNLSVKGLLLDTQCNLLERNPTKQELGNPEFLTALLYWGLKAKHPDITKEEVDVHVMVFRYLPYIVSQATSAISVFRPDMTGMELDKGGVDDTEDPM